MILLSSVIYLCILTIGAVWPHIKCYHITSAVTSAPQHQILSQMLLTALALAGYLHNPRSCFNQKTIFLGMGIPVIKIRCSWDFITKYLDTFCLAAGYIQESMSIYHGKKVSLRSDVIISPLLLHLPHNIRSWVRCHQTSMPWHDIYTPRTPFQYKGWFFTNIDKIIMSLHYLYHGDHFIDKVAFFIDRAPGLLSYGNMMSN